MGDQRWNIQNHPKDTCGGTIAIILGALKYLIIMVQGKSYMEYIHNIVDEGFMAKKNLQVVDFEVFRVANVNGKFSLCDKVVK